MFFLKIYSFLTLKEKKMNLSELISRKNLKNIFIILICCGLGVLLSFLSHELGKHDKKD